jgi:hypothetical protein
VVPEGWNGPMLRVTTSPREGRQLTTRGAAQRGVTSTTTLSMPSTTR